MIIKLLGDGLRATSGCVVVRIGNYVLKIPLSFIACQELNKEKNFLEKLKSDKHFSRYVPEYRYFFCMLCISYLAPLREDDRWEEKMEAYFKLAFGDSHEWKEVDLKNLIEHTYFMDFILRYLPDELIFWENFFCKTKMPQSSAHGDFHEGNILAKHDRLFFIDWVDYRSQSSRYFDLFDYYIFLYKNKDTSWIEKWKLEFLENKKASIWGVKITHTHAIGYAIWRISAELEMLTVRKKMTEQKIHKYRNLITPIFLSMSNQGY